MLDCPAGTGHTDEMHERNTQGAASTAGAPDRDDPGSSAEGDVPPSSAHHPDSDIASIEIDPGLLSDAHAATLRDAVTSAVGNLARPVERIGIQVVDDEAMIALHSKWHNLDSTTDVLTFESDTHGPIDVDIAVCLDEASRQAGTRGHAAVDELVLYVLHGLLHCCGHDDQTPETRTRMFAAQDDLLRTIGRRPISKDVS